MTGLLYRTGPSVYEVSLTYELEQRGLKVERQTPVPVSYKGVSFEIGFRSDLIVEGKVLACSEPCDMTGLFCRTGPLKSVEKVTPSHKKLPRPSRHSRMQWVRTTQTYLKLMDLRLGYLLNFGEALMVDGITRCVNKLNESPSSAS